LCFTTYKPENQSIISYIKKKVKFILKVNYEYTVFDVAEIILKNKLKLKKNKNDQHS